MKRVGIICKRGRPEPVEILAELAPWLIKRGVEVYADNPAVSGVKIVEFHDMPGLVDMVIVLGGDGTMLGAARLFSRHKLPLLGVNLGGLGFITEVAVGCLYDVIHDVLEGRYFLENRMMLKAAIVRKGETFSEHEALNDIVVNKGMLAQIIDLEVHINGRYVNLFKADGMIVSTPTGSTAYNMSAGGPILYPTIQSIVLTPICPHSLTNKPIVLPDDAEIEIRLRSHGDEVMLTYDGVVAERISAEDRIIVKRAQHTSTLVMPVDRNHFDVLRRKLRWGER